MWGRCLPGHAFRPFQHGIDVHQLGSIPMLLQDAQQRSIGCLCCGRRVVQQVDGLADVIGEVHQALEELGPHPAAFRAIIDLELDMRDRGLLGHREVVPPVLQAVDDEIAGFAGASKGQMELSACPPPPARTGMCFSSPPCRGRRPGGPTVFPPTRVLVQSELFSKLLILN